MTDRTSKGQTDFSVTPSSGNSHKIFKIYHDLKRNIKPSILRNRLSAGETQDEFLISTAIHTSNLTGALFRKAESADEALSLAWLSLVKRQANNMLANGIAGRFRNFGAGELWAVARLSSEPNNIKYLSEILAANHGILLVIEEYLPGMKLDGCCFRLSNGTPVVGISIRYNRYDNFWFTLTHELAHIALHYDLLTSPILDDLDENNSSDIETEANRMASDSLVPRDIIRKALLNQVSEARIYELSDKAKTHPAIIAGMIRHKTKNWAIYSDLVNFMDIKRELNIS